MADKVYFIGAGPGDPELLTLKARRIIGQADVIIYADSLVNPEVCFYAKKEAAVHRSASLDLEQITGLIVDAIEEGKMVARIQSGDPAIFGAIREQMEILDEKGIEYEVIPGVSSLFAAAAALKAELTVPEVSQTIIITRQEGRTPVPAGQSLKSLAEHRASLAVFLSAALAEKVAGELIAGGLSEDAPAAIVYRASWPEEKVIRTTLKNLAGEMAAAGITQQALILAGEFLNGKANKQKSKLYDRNFEHGYRKS